MYQKILDISRRRGIIYPSFEIYGGVSGFYDYGPVGALIKNNVENLIREYYLIDEGCLEVQCPTLSPESVWIASGHVQNFADMMTECLKCGEPYRADHLIKDQVESADGMNIEDVQKFIDERKIKCPKCKGDLDRIYNYNLMFGTHIGPGRSKIKAYLRPETAQTTYLGFKRLWEVARKKLPFGVLQIGHSFRNEISPRQGMIRLREFNQAEIQFFTDPEVKTTPRFGEVSGIKTRILHKNTSEPVEMTIGEAFEQKIIGIQLVAYFLGKSLRLFTDMGINPNQLSLRQHLDNERAFYSSDTWDIEYNSPGLGRIELVGIADRTDYDLKQHMNLSKEDMQVTFNNHKFVPHVVEVAYGIDRPIYCILESCIHEEPERTIFTFPPKTAPYLAGIFPLVEKDGIPEKAKQIFETLRNKRLYVFKDHAGSIGKRYARADEIGVPYCITVDYQTLEDDTVTVRERDTRSQTRVKVPEIAEKILGKIV